MAKIITKYHLGDTVYFFNKNNQKITSGKIVMIHFVGCPSTNADYIRELYIVSYTGGATFDLDEYELFPSEDELIQSLKSILNYE